MEEVEQNTISLEAFRNRPSAIRGKYKKTKGLF